MCNHAQVLGKAKIVTIGMHSVFSGFEFEPDTKIVWKRAFFKGLTAKSNKNQKERNRKYPNSNIIFVEVLNKKLPPNIKLISKISASSPIGVQYAILGNKALLKEVNFKFLLLC